MTPPYRFISFTALLLTSGTRKRPPQSGSVQTGIPEAQYSAAFDSVSVCFSKALAPLSGAALLARGRSSLGREGSNNNLEVASARRIIAAGALYALENHRSRLGETRTNTTLSAVETPRSVLANCFTGSPRRTSSTPLLLIRDHSVVDSTTRAVALGTLALNSRPRFTK
jgi:hypothetical protein